MPSTDHLLCSLPSKMNVRTAMDLFMVSHPLIKRDDDCQASAPMMSSK
ncbi:MAG: hypothetical protein ACEY3L_20120 [Wolbachia sp.]